MATKCSRLTMLAAALVFLAPAIVQAQGILVFDFSTVRTTGNQYSLTGTGQLRRGTTSSVRVIKHLIDLVPDGMINVSGGGSLTGSITHGRTSSNIGFIEVKIAVPAGQTPGSTITLNVGASDHFPFRVLRKGLLTSVTFAPNPTTLNGGQPFTINVSGEDLGTPSISTVACHNAVAGPSSNTAFATTMTKFTNTTNCTSGNTGPFGLSVRSTATNDPGVYTTSTGIGNFTFGPYIAPPPSGIACTSVPNIGAPVITAPANGQRIVFGAGASASQSITVRWNERTAPDNRLAPNNEWIVTFPSTSTRGTVSSPTVIQPTSTATVIGLQKSISLTIPGTYTVRVRANNCGVVAPTTSTTFELSY